MGAGASVVNTDGIPDDVKSLIDAIERQKQKIAEYDTSIMEKEMNKMFKGHNQIIDELTARTKSQIKNLFLHCPQSVKYLDQLNDGGNQYAKFIQQLAIPKELIEIQQVKASSHEYDEELLVDIIGTSTVKEIKAFDELLIKEKSYSLYDLFSSQCKNDTPLFRFLDIILKYNRDESKHADLELANQQASIIHKAGASRLLGVDEEPIFEILATASRTQCLLINEVYQEMFKMKLERAINMKFKGNCGKLLVMWTQSVPQAVVTCISYLSQKILVDKFSIAQLLAKYDKDILSLTDEACQNIHRKPLAEFLKKCLTGNLHRVCKGWIELPSPDKGFEKIVTLYLESKLQNEYSHAADKLSKEPPKEVDGSGKTDSASTDTTTTNNELIVNWKVLLEDTELCQKFKFLLEKQGQEIKLYMIDKKIKLDASDQGILSRANTRANSTVSLSNFSANSNSGSNLHSKSTSALPTPTKTTAALSPGKSRLSIEASDENIRESDEEETVDQVGSLKKIVSNPDNGRRYSIFSSNSASDLKAATKNDKTREHEILSQSVYDYLLQYFEQFDTEDEGCFTSESFWKIVQSLPLDDLGFTATDIETIQQFCAWENEDDGKIYYYEVLFEFAESVMTAIENKSTGEKSVKNIIALVSKNIKSSKLDIDNIVPDVRTSNVLKNSNSIRNLEGKEFQAASSKLKRMSTIQFPKVPIYFKQYLIDTVLAFDFDLNGCLTRNELDSLGAAMNIPALDSSRFLGDQV